MATTGFNIAYNTPNVDIGSGYAQGIGQAGKSIAESLAGVTSIMDQSQAANDQIDMMTKLKDAQGNPILSQEDADALMAKGLTARHAFIGELMGRFHTNYSTQLEQQNKLQQIQVNAATAATNRQAEIAQTAEEQRKALVVAGAQQRQTQAEQARLNAEAENRKNIILVDPAELKKAEAEKQRRITSANQTKALQSPSGGGALH